MNKLLFFLLFTYLTIAQINSGCFDDDYTMQVGLSVWTPDDINGCEDGVDYLISYGYGCNTALSDLNNPFWGSNPDETITNICSCTCEDIVIETLGCTDNNACNYNPLATDDDGSCTYAEEYYDCDGNCLNDIDGDGICDELEINGCTAVTACNYNDNATEDDGSCVYTVAVCDTCSGETNGTGVVVDNDSDDDGICNADEVAGCIDDLACNFEDLATDDDGLCIYPGDPCIAGILEGGELIYGMYNEDCMCVENNSFIKEPIVNKQLIKVIDLLGRDIQQNGFIIKIYNNGTVEKAYFY